MSPSAGSGDYASRVADKVAAALAARLIAIGERLDAISGQLTAIHQGVGNLRGNMSDLAQQVAELRRRLDGEDGAAEG